MKNQSLVWVPLQKIDADKRLVYGYASTAAADWDGENLPVDVLKKAIPGYEKFGNIREMHQLSAVGVLDSSSLDDKGYSICAKVVDDAAWKKVKEGVYKGFSIGGKKAVDPLTKTITRAVISEISLVDRPNNPECLIEMFKVADAPMTKGMFEVADLSSVIRTLGYLISQVDYEQSAEMDQTSTVPSKLRDAFKTLAEALKDMTEEEVSEAFTTLGITESTLTKGIVMTPEEQKNFDELKKLVSDQGAQLANLSKTVPAPVEAPVVAPVIPVPAMDPQLAELKKIVDEQAAKLEAMSKAAAPVLVAAGPGGAVAAPAKGMDSASVGSESLVSFQKAVDAFKADPTEDNKQKAMRTLYAQPQELSMLKVAPAGAGMTQFSNVAQ